VNIVHELLEGADLLYKMTGRPAIMVLVPRWRGHELMMVTSDLNFSYVCSGEKWDFKLAGLKGFWWDNDYIEYRCSPQGLGFTLYPIAPPYGQ
jgi:hypothetical protein